QGRGPDRWQCPGPDPGSTRSQPPEPRRSSTLRITSMSACADRDQSKTCDCVRPAADCCAQIVSSVSAVIASAIDCGSSGSKYIAASAAISLKMGMSDTATG